MPVDGRGTAIVVAHPDDETVGCAALLPWLFEVPLILVTDGAPRNLDDARAAGFRDAADYAAARRRELMAALEIAGSQPQVIALDIPDQTAADNLVPLTRRITELLHQLEVSSVLTHAYEGGHPDHDATAYAVHHAVQLLSREKRAIDILEMPFYRLGPAGLLTQTFTEPAGQVLEIELTPDEISRKRRMIESYGTQRAVLEMFDIAVERYRVAPEYDFTALPNQGRLFYEQQDWGMDGQRWLQLARSAQQQLRSKHPVMASLP